MKTATLDRPRPACRHIHRRRPLRPGAAASDQHVGPPRTPPAGRRHRPSHRDRGPSPLPAARLLQPVRCATRLQRRCAAGEAPCGVRRPPTRAAADGAALSAAAELQWAFDRRGGAGPSPHRVERAGHVSAGERCGDGSAPSGAAALDDSAADAAPHRTSAPPDSPPLVLDAAGRQKLVEEAAGKSARQVRRMLADLDPDLAPPADRVRPLGDGRYELKAVIDADCQHGLEQLRGLLSHVDPRMTIGQVVGRIVQEALDRHDPSRPPRRARTASRSAEGDCKPTSASKEQAARERGHASTAKDAACRHHSDSGVHGGADAATEPAGSDGRPSRCPAKTDRRLLRQRSDALGPRDSGGRATTGVAAGRPAAAATSIGRPDAAATHDT